MAQSSVLLIDILFFSTGQVLQMTMAGRGAECDCLRSYHALLKLRGTPQEEEQKERKNWMEGRRVVDPHGMAVAIRTHNCSYLPRTCTTLDPQQHSVMDGGGVPGHC